MRRWRLWALAGALVLLLLVAVGFVSRFAVRPPMFTEDDCAGIKEGMTEEQVEGVLGMPPGYYGSRPGVRGIGSGPMRVEVHPKGVANDDGSASRAWIGDEGEIVVDFDERGAVKDKRFVKVWPPPETWTDKIRRWLGW